MRTTRFFLLITLWVVVSCITSAHAQQDQASGSPSGSLMVNAGATLDPSDLRTESHALREQSMFAIVPPKAREIQKHDLVQIIVRESSRVKSIHELETDKEYGIDGSITAFPNLNLGDILDFQVEAGRTTGLPRLSVDFTKEFSGEGDYRRRDDFTARLTAEVLEVLPNGNLVLEARTYIRNDEEILSIKVTGICRQEDVTAINTVLSSQIHDLKIVKEHEGELKKANEKGFVAKILDAIFAF